MAGKDKDELSLQRQIIQSARKVGGYGRKISHKFQVGIPDLSLVVPGYVPGIWEVKDFGAVTAKFDRDLEVTDKQSIELMEYHKAANEGQFNSVICCGVLLGYKMNGLHSLMILPYTARRAKAGDGPVVIREKGGFYDLHKLFWDAGVNRWTT